MCSGGNLDPDGGVKSQDMTSPAEELRRLLSRLPREEPPDIPLERLLLQLASARRRTVSAVAAALAAGLIMALTLGSTPEDPPVYLDLYVVQVDQGEESAAGPRPSTGDTMTDLPEFDRP